MDFIVCALLILVVCQPSSAHSSPIFPAKDDAERMAWLKVAVDAAVTKLDINHCGNQGTILPCGGRDFSNGALGIYLLSEGKNVSGIMHWLRRVQPGGSFVGQAFCSLAHEPTFMNSLNEIDKAWFIESMNKALPGLSSWKGADVSYSNMYFMGMTNCMICGEAPMVNSTLGQAAAENGYKLLEEWKQYAASAGNHEFNSPTYYWVQINAIQLGCMYAKRNAKANADLCQILDHLWANVAANFFSPTETLSGPHSRDYDFVFGHGALQVHTYINGLGTHAPICEAHDAHCERTNGGQNALILLNALRARDASGIGYIVPEDILKLSRISPVRIVESKWLGQQRDANNQSDRFGDRYNYVVTGQYTIGSTSADYITNTHHAYYPHPQDKLVDIEFGVPDMSQLHPIPSITIVPGWKDQPYGHFYVPSTDKPSHLATHPGNVQFENILLNTNALNPTEQLDGFNQTVFDNLATSVILPLDHVAAFVVDGIVVSIPRDGPFVKGLGIGNTVTMRVQNTCATIRVLHVDGAGGVEPVVELKADQYGIPLGAMRIAAYHYRGPNQTLPDSTHVKTAFLFLMDTCESQSELLNLNEEVRTTPVHIETTDDMEWVVEAVVRKKTLKVVRDISEPHCLRWSCLINRTIDGNVVSRKSLQVNGKIVGPLPPP
jgi:hypothetical protein